MSRVKNQNIQVYVRARPLNAAERGRGSCSIMETGDHTVTLKERPQDKITKSFTFDRVFGPQSKQLDVYRVVAMPLLKQVLLGYNCTVFAYGQTGSGKTFTMEGERSDERLPWDQDPDVGIIPRTMSQLFDELRIQEVEFTTRVSFLELYNEELFDLLGPETNTTRLRLYEDSQKKGSCIIQGLEEVTVHNKNDVYDILRQGSQKRRTAATLMNAHSSRSHTVFSVTVHIKESTVDGEELLKTGKLNLVDLAGSENVGRSGAVDRRAREAGNINQSLLTLGRVITSLVERAPHVPYRESKLTRLLQDSLGGRTKTSIIAAVSPASCDLEETLSTLDYANRAKNIQNRPEVNQKLSKKALMKEYTEEIERLRRDLLATREQNGVYLAADNYDKLTSTIEVQEKEIVEKVNHIRALEEESEKKQAVFTDLKAALDERTTALKDRESELCDTRASLVKTKQDLQWTEVQRDEQSHLVERRADTERRLVGQAGQLLTTVSETTADLRGVHDKLDRKRSLEERNDAVTREFRVQFQADMARLESALGAAFQQQREFCKGMYANLGEAVERRKHESSALTALLGSLLGSQTEQLRELESHSQSAAGGAHAWIGAQLAAVAARRDQQGELHTALQRRLTVGAEAALQRLERLDAAAEKAAAEQRGWLSAHSAQMETALTELAALLQTQQRKRRADDAERVARLERENQRLLDKQANLTALIESLQASLATVASATAASSKAAQALASGVGDDGSASAAALANERAQLEAMQRQEAASYSDAGQRLSRARSQLGEDHARLDQIQQQATEEMSLQSGEARGELERARSSWGPALAELTDGWEQHCQRQEEALRARSEAVNGELQHSQQRVQGLAGSLHGAVRGADQQLEAQSRAFFATIRDRQGELTDQCGRIEQQAVDISQMVRRRDNEVEVFVVETLQRDASTGGTPQRRDFTYPRYLAATSPHERILQRFRSAHRRDARSHSSGAADAPDAPPLPALDTEELLEESSDSVETVVEETPSPAPVPEQRLAAPAPDQRHAPAPVPEQRPAPAPLTRAPSDTDSGAAASDTGSDAENRAPEKRFNSEFAVPAARRHHRRGLRAPKVHVARQSPHESPARSPLKPVLRSKND